MTTDQILERLITRYPALKVCKYEIKAAGLALIDSYNKQGQLLICGNGGSSADSDHIVGEMMKSFCKKRPLNDKLTKALKELSTERGALLATKLEQGLPSISLSAHSALMTAVANDIGDGFIFAQQVVGYGKKGDVFLGISTSGNSQNVIDACIVAKAKEMIVIVLTGESGGQMKAYADIAICVPSTITSDIQEFHLPIYHALCIMAEEAIF